MRRAVFTEENAVMGKNKDRADPHEGSKANSRPHVIRKDQEGRAIGYQSTECHSVQRSAHRVLAHPKMEIPRAVIAFSEIAFSFDKRVRRWRQVRRTSKQRR